MTTEKKGPNKTILQSKPYKINSAINAFVMAIRQ